MRVGPWQITKAAQGKPPVGELGAPGTQVTPSAGGLGVAVLSEADYNPDLVGTKLYDEVDRMRKSDSQVKAALGVIKLPLLASEWRMVPATDSSEDKDIATWIENQLKTQLRHNWYWILRHILLHLDFGSMPFETLWGVKDDSTFNRPMVALTDLAPRLPRTVKEWRLDQHGQLAGIVQSVSTTEAFEDISIPADKLLVFVNEQEGGDYRGTSILRAARKDWILKERAQRLNAIRIEKRGVGTDVGTLTGSPSDAKKADAEKVLMTIRGHERAYVLETDDFKYRTEGIGAGSVDPLPTIKYCDLMILRGVLAEFLAMGGDSTGSLAMHKDKSSFFLMALRAIAGQVESVMNRELFPRWVAWNWPNIEKFPQITHGRLDRRDVLAIAEGLSKLIPIGAVTPDEGIEREVRELLEMPERESIESPSASRAAKKRHIDLADFSAMKKGLETAEDDIVTSYRVIQNRQIARLVEEAIKAIESGNPDKLRHISVPFKQEAADRFADPLKKLYKQGQQEVVKELSRSGKVTVVQLAIPLDPSDDDDVLEFLIARSRAVASSLAERLRGSMLKNGLDQIRKGEADKSSLLMNLKSLSDSNIKREARAATSEALNLGRQSTAKRNEDKIKGMEYSAIMDDGTCDPCSDLDGQEYTFGSAAAAEVEPPYRNCDGHGNCRCVFIYTFEED